MKYYSDVTKEVYDTQEALVKAEDAEVQKQAEAEQKAKQRKERAKEVEDAFKAVLDAQAHYTELKNKFIEDYEGFHMTVRHKSPVKWAADFSDLLDFFFGF